MAWQFNVNNLGAVSSDVSGDQIMALTDLMALHGTHEIVGAGDGLAHYENEGDTAGPYDFLSTVGNAPYPSGTADDFSNPLAWLRFREIGTTREWVFSRYSNPGANFHPYMCLAFSATGFVATGIATATLPPTPPADVHYLWGTGYGALAGGLWGPAFGVTNRWHVGVNDAEVNGVHAWSILAFNESTKATTMSVVHEPLVGGPAGDLQPWIFWRGVSAAGMHLIEMDINSSGYSDYGGGGELWADGRVASATGYSWCPVKDVANAIIAPGFIATQSDGFGRSYNIPVARNVSGVWRGHLANVRWSDTDARQYPATVNSATVDGAYIYVDNCLVRFETGTIPL